MNDARIAIALRNAEKVFPSGVRALEPIDLAVREGDFATVIGPSGCGKSTLLRMIAGLVTPSRGGVALWPAGMLTSNGDKPRLAFVFQSPTLMPWASVEKNVRLPLELLRLEQRAAQGKVDHALELVGIKEFRHAYPRELSGGMQMRVSIARALVTGPQLLLMDEPFGALDEITRSKLDHDIRDLWAQEALTVLFVTHNIYEAVYLSNRVIVMSARPGQIYREVVIDEPHPRTEALRGSERFARHCAQLSELLAAASNLHLVAAREDI
jgi:NitT/TauT family transport system ATP-binding protein